MVQHLRRQLRTVGHVQLAVDPGEVLLHRADRDVQASADLPVGVPERGQPGDPALRVAQDGRAGVGLGAVGPYRILQQVRVDR